LEDPLNLICLFLTIPCRSVKGYGPETYDEIKLLYSQFQQIIIRKNWLRKVFVSIKGFYFQAEIHGNKITWLVPHQFNRTLPEDVDFVCLITFLEFYKTLLKFVNFKLYHDEEIKYPPSPVIDNNSVSCDNPNNLLLFKDFSFLLMKETPVDVLSFIIRSFGGKTFDESDLLDKPKITHKIVDRNVDNLNPNSSALKFSESADDINNSNFEVIQPQW